MKPFTSTQQTRIANNIVAACREISKLNGPAYKFIMNCPGFIAHYNLHGFIAHYENNNLSADILANRRFNQWVNFHPGETWYEYYMSCKAIYNAICEELTGTTCPDKFIREHVQFIRIGA
jgi:hypothetical protein